MILGPDERPDLFRTEVKLSYCTLAVHDLDQSLRFYRDVLGFQVRDDVEFEGMRWVSVSAPSQPDVQIVLEPPGVHRGATPADQQAIRDLMANGLLGRLVFVTDDCDATFERVEAAGAEVMQEPIDQPSGVRDCAFCDPSGNLLRFTQPAADSPGNRVTPSAGVSTGHSTQNCLPPAVVSPA
ncbi:VOC family protein [Micromonospora sp. NBC_01796]|uniref:VOC family protein n=1 Tax=Micromonospora sp. NBC_01796 TaxID=2975987 RepID=UPI002DD9F2CB|nr:VOC family protein [Micromonospora sp. NBC_01796]WSA84508.1 VOC family protein [Micromonospora sp. NBC_01796]